MTKYNPVDVVTRSISSAKSRPYRIDDGVVDGRVNSSDTGVSDGYESIVMVLDEEPKATSLKSREKAVMLCV